MNMKQAAIDAYRPRKKSNWQKERALNIWENCVGSGVYYNGKTGRCTRIKRTRGARSCKYGSRVNGACPKKPYVYKRKPKSPGTLLALRKKKLNCTYVLGRKWNDKTKRCMRPPKYVPSPSY